MFDKSAGICRRCARTPPEDVSSPRAAPSRKPPKSLEDVSFRRRFAGLHLRAGPVFKLPVPGAGRQPGVRTVPSAGPSDNCFAGVHMAIFVPRYLDRHSPRPVTFMNTDINRTCISMYLFIIYSFLRIVNGNTDKSQEKSESPTHPPNDAVPDITARIRGKRDRIAPQGALADEDEVRNVGGREAGGRTLQSGNRGWHQRRWHQRRFDSGCRHAVTE